MNPSVKFVFLKEANGEIDNQLNDLANKYTVLSLLPYEDESNNKGILASYTDLGALKNEVTSQGTK